MLVSQIRGRNANVVSVNAVKETRNVLISLLNSSNQDRELHDEEVLSAGSCLLLSGDYRCLFMWWHWEEGGDYWKKNGQEVVKTSAISQQQSTWKQPVDSTWTLHQCFTTVLMSVYVEYVTDTGEGKFLSLSVPRWLLFPLRLCSFSIVKGKSRHHIYR